MQAQTAKFLETTSKDILEVKERTIRIDMETYGLLRQVQSSIGMRLPSSQDCIIFTDVLGRTQSLPYQQFKDWEVVEAMLKCQFRDLPGEQRVLGGRYHVLNAKRKGLIIDKNRWGRSVFPGSQITMSVILTTEAFPVGICPRPGCGQINSLPYQATISW
jgi:hypothetical protein